MDWSFTRFGSADIGNLGLAFHQQREGEWQQMSARRQQV